jgi:hypothetical protein
MCKLLDMFRPKSRDVRKSDFGRRFGWFIERGGECIGELEYSRWDEDSQFWHEYRVNWRRPEGDAARIEDWAESGIELRNREFSDVVVREFLSASGCAEGLVAIRNAFVPEARFRMSTKKANTPCVATGDSAHG